MAKKWSPLWTCALLVSLCGFTSSCPVAEKRLLVKCLKPLLALEKHPSMSSDKGCSIISTFIDCVENSLVRCQNFVQKKDIFSQAERLKAEYCNVEATSSMAATDTAPTTTSVTATNPTATLTKNLSTLADKDTIGQTLADEGRQEIEEKFHLCRDYFTKHNPTTINEGCRLAVTFLTCGDVVLQGYKISLDTLYLHAELLRNRAIYWQYCAHESGVLDIKGVPTGGCQSDATRRLQACLAVTKTMTPHNPKAFCSLAPKYFSCLAEIVHECSDAPHFERADDFLMDSLDLQKLHCPSPRATVFSRTGGLLAPVLPAPQYENKHYPNNEERDVIRADGDDVTSTGSGSEESVLPSTMPWEPSSGESIVSNSEMYQGSGNDVSSLEPDTSGSGALLVQEDTAHSMTSANSTPWKPEDLPNKEEMSGDADNSTSQTANGRKMEDWADRTETNKTERGNNPWRNPKPVETLSTNKPLNGCKNESLAPDRFTPGGYRTENEHPQGAATARTYPAGSSFRGQKASNRHGSLSRKNVKGDHSITDIKARGAKRAKVHTAPADCDSNQSQSGGEKNRQSPVTPTTPSQQSTALRYDPPAGRNQADLAGKGPQLLSSKSHTLITENKTEDEVEDNSDDASEWGDYPEEESDNEDAEGEEEEEIIKLSAEELAQWSGLEPWGKGCSKPWSGHSLCTSIMMATPFGHRAEECRSLRLYISCLRSLMDACKDFTPFYSIPNTIRYISPRYKQNCNA